MKTEIKIQESDTIARITVERLTTYLSKTELHKLIHELIITASKMKTK